MHRGTLSRTYRDLASRLILFAVICSAAVGLATRARAQTTLYLDFTSGPGLGANNDFTWDTTAALWNTDFSGNAARIPWNNAGPPNNAVLGGSGNVGGETNIGINTYVATLASNISVGKITFGTANWNIALGTNTLTLDSSSDYSLPSQIYGPGAVVKNGTNTLTLESDNNSVGTVTVNAGVLVLGGSNSAIGTLRINPNAIFRIGNVNALGSLTGSLVLAGGTFQMGVGFDVLLTAPLQVIANSVLDFGLGIGSTKILFGNSTALPWNGQLTVLNYTTASDTLSFGSGGLTAAQLAAIKFNNNIAAQIDANGNVTPIPEPATYALLLGAGSLALAVYRRRRGRHDTVQESALTA